MMTTVLITGVGGGVAQSAIRALRISGLDLRLIGTDMSPEAVGFYSLDSAYLTPPHNHPTYVDRLLDIAIHERVDIVVPGLDPEVLLLSKSKDLFQAQGIQLLCGNHDSVSVCRNKLKTYSFFESKGMPFVRTLPISAVMQCLDTIEFPLFAKPFDGSASRGAFVLFDHDDLRRAFAEGHDLIVQDYLVPKSWGIAKRHMKRSDAHKGSNLRQEDELGAVVYVTRDGTVLSSFLCIFELANGVLLNAKPYDDASVRQTAESMVRELAAIGMVGPISLQGRITEDGPEFYEVNPRLTGGAAMSAGFGFNHARAAIEDFVLKLSHEEIEQKLSVNYELVCKRYITEIIFPACDNSDLKLHKHTVRLKGTSLVL